MIDNNEQLHKALIALSGQTTYHEGKQFLSALSMVLQWDIADEFLVYIHHFVMANLKNRLIHSTPMPAIEFSGRANALLDDCLRDIGPLAENTQHVQQLLARAEELGVTERDCDELVTAERLLYRKQRS